MSSPDSEELFLSGSNLTRTPSYPGKNQSSYNYECTSATFLKRVRSVFTAIPMLSEGISCIYVTLLTFSLFWPYFIKRVAVRIVLEIQYIYFFFIKENHSSHP